MGSQQEPQTTGVWIFKEQDAEGILTGRITTFEGVELQPLRYSDLAGMKLDGPVNIPLNWSGARIVENDILELSIGDMANLRTHLESQYANKAIGLVRGGWLPSGLALREDMVVMPDRCTISELASRYRDGKKTRAGEDFLDLFQGKPVRIHPGLFALEGNKRRIPTPQQVAEQWAEASRKVRVALPEAQLTPDSAVEGLVGLLEDMRESMARKVQFLCQVAPRLQSPISSRRRAEIWRQVLEVAHDCGLQRHTLVVLAALSIVCVENGAGPAKRLIKPSRHYSAEDAYNALADLRALELLINFYALFPQEQIMLCTGDKNLALFWAGIRASGFMRGANGSVIYTLSPVEALLPNVTPNLWEAYMSA
ncbi:hypothetical protein [Pseudomonas sp. ok266]|jgi:hypothetical protein|uniref:hypothetical protein n=1 Tax=Pseudomonas sp. ok266 TaxID=1761896 RepID=UPI0008BB1AA6|nr:hypothetical protein [Pseudomonas sp. ok266]SEN97848.1 hypothetical protein SAMN04487856_105228 [Pseudomonas sp. ok266]